MSTIDIRGQSHPSEFDQLFIGFFDEVLNGEKKISRQELINRIEGVDFQGAAEIIAYAFREVTGKGEGIQYAAKKEFKDATDHYIERPCFERAISLLEKYPSWLGLFELTKDPTYIRTRNYTEPRNLKPYEPGFVTPNGKFLTPKEAVKWMEKNQPKVYKK